MNTKCNASFIRPPSKESPTWTLPKLQLVFWLDTIGSVVALLIATITGDLGGISGFLFLLATTTCDCCWSGMSYNCSVATVLRLAMSVSLSRMSLSVFFFSGFLALGFVALVPLFDLVGFTLALKDRGRFLGTFRLIMPEIENHLQRLFFLGA